VTNLDEAYRRLAAILTQREKAEWRAEHEAIRRERTEFILSRFAELRPDLAAQDPVEIPDEVLDQIVFEAVRRRDERNAMLKKVVDENRAVLDRLARYDETGER